MRKKQKIAGGFLLQRYFITVLIEYCNVEFPKKKINIPTSFFFSFFTLPHGFV